MIRPQAALMIAWIAAMAGCQQSVPPSHESAKVSLPAEVSPSELLSQQEIDAFVRILKRMPDGQAPEFSETILPRLQSADQLGVDIAELRKAIRIALTPEHQAAEWQKDPALRLCFAELQVDPVVFAAQTLRISCAWSAWTIQQQASLQEAETQLNSRMARLIDQLQSPQLVKDSSQQRELLQTLEEVIVMSEFVEILGQVPEGSLRSVASARRQLEEILPESTLAREFAELVETQSTILRTSHETSFPRR